MDSSNDGYSLDGPRHGLVSWQRNSYKDYVNYGWYYDTPEMEDADLGERLRLRLDTWYLSDDEILGKMDLGSCLTTNEEASRFLTQQFQNFQQSFSLFVHVDQQVEVSFHKSLTSVVSYWVRAAPDYLAEVVRTQTPPDGRIQGLSARFSVNVAYRNRDGTIAWHWIPEAGRFWITANPGAGTAEYLQDSVIARFHATLMMDTVSLFRADNWPVLSTVRQLWGELRTQNPGLTKFTQAPNMVNTDLVVTLARPPDGTPHDNHELARLNLPRLHAAIARWEQSTGYPFEWAEPFTH